MGLYRANFKGKKSKAKAAPTKKAEKPYPRTVTFSSGRKGDPKPYPHDQRLRTAVNPKTKKRKAAAAKAAAAKKKAAIPHSKLGPRGVRTPQKKSAPKPKKAAPKAKSRRVQLQSVKRPQTAQARGTAGQRTQQASVENIEGKLTAKQRAQVAKSLKDPKLSAAADAKSQNLRRKHDRASDARETRNARGHNRSGNKWL